MRQRIRNGRHRKQEKQRSQISKNILGILIDLNTRSAVQQRQIDGEQGSLSTDRIEGDVLSRLLRTPLFLDSGGIVSVNIPDRQVRRLG